jgi:hypothetical protein
LTWSHPELHPSLWTNALGTAMPAPDGDITLGVAQAIVPERPTASSRCGSSRRRRARGAPGRDRRADDRVRRARQGGKDREKRIEFSAGRPPRSASRWQEKRCTVAEPRFDRALRSARALPIVALLFALAGG